MLFFLTFYFNLFQFICFPRPQHLSGLRLIRDLTEGKLTGDEVGSTEITFHPNAIKGGKYHADPGTAGLAF